MTNGGGRRWTAKRLQSAVKRVRFPSPLRLVSNGGACSIQVERVVPRGSSPPQDRYLPLTYMPWIRTFDWPPKLVNRVRLPAGARGPVVRPSLALVCWKSNGVKGWVECSSRSLSHNTKGQKWYRPLDEYIARSQPLIRGSKQIKTHKCRLRCSCRSRGHFG